MTKLEEARERLINDLTDSGETSRIAAARLLAALERAVRDEEAEECAAVAAILGRGKADDIIRVSDAIRSRIAARKEGK